MFRKTYSSFVIASAFLFSFTYASVIQNQRIENGSEQSIHIQNTLQQTAKMWGLKLSDYRHYLKDMKDTPAGFWWKNVDPPMVLAMLAKTKSQRLKYTIVDIKLDIERTHDELAYQHLYDQEFNALYPRAKAIVFPHQHQLKAGNIQNGDRYYLFTPIEDPEGGLLTSKFIALLHDRSNVSLNIFFVGKTTVPEIESWAKRNNLPKSLVDEGVVTLNQNNATDQNTLQSVLGRADKGLSNLPVLVRVREGHSQIMSVLNV